MVAGGDLLARGALLDRLEECSRYRLCLVHAGAGYGKTSLLAMLRKRLLAKNMDVAWLTLDNDDQDPRLFSEYVIAALGHIGIGASQAPATDTASGAASGKLLLSIVINALSAHRQDVVIVLDDYEKASCPDVDALTAFLLEHAPSNLHVVVATRDRPKIGIADLRMRGELLEFGNHDLRLGADEIKQFLEMSGAGEWTSKDLQRIIQYTEGWIIAVRMAHLIARGQDGGGTLESLSGSAFELASYLSEQVFS
ncbi:MAG: hypothetical protein MI723_05565, partial [Caulobacterales bacterium]|nr:hypothetical protein [Caulobacterales bacterium]